MNNFLLQAYNAVSNTDFEEIPVEIEEFVQSEDFLNLPPLSDYQYQMIRAGSQIYKYDTLVSLYGRERGEKRFRETCNEVILQLGKGSGKDYTSTIAVAYVVYLLLCLKDPAKYYGKPAEDTIDIVNIAINADQARNVFFENLLTRIRRCKWFDNRIERETGNSLEFDKHVRVFSGHSEREAFEGLNLILAVLDEISGFALESTTGNVKAKTAQSTYDMYRDSVDSRFAEFGKVLMLSFPRFEKDYIQQAYNRVIAEKEVVIKTHTFKIDPNLPDGTEGNEFTIEWEEDHIIRYTDPHIFALRRPTWEVNPTVSIDSPAMVRAFRTNPGNALGKFACMPSNLEDGFFKDESKINAAFVKQNGVDESGIFLDSFLPKKDTKYFMHVDLAQKHDHCAVAMAHVDRWQEITIGSAGYHEIHPFVIVDAVRWWTPTADKSVDFKDVVDFIKAVRRRGFDLKLVTFDRWNSHDTMNDLERNGIKTGTLSVDKPHYDDFMSVMYDSRMIGPNVELLKKELGELRPVIKGKKVVIDHPRKGSKDLSDAVCGAIFDAVKGTPRPRRAEIEVVTLDQITAAERAEKEARQEADGVIRPPKRSRMPEEIESYLSAAKIL